MLKAVFAAALSAASAVWRLTRRRPRAMKQFARDLVADPDYREWLDAEHERLDAEYERLARARDEARAAPPPTAAEFPRLIDDLLSPDRQRAEVAEIHLGKVAAEAEQPLLAALDDPRAVWTRDDDQTVATAPAERVARLLAAIPSRALGDRIGHLADHADGHVSRPAIKARAALGRADQLPFVLVKLAEQSSEAQEGVELAIARGWAEPAFLEGLRDWAERATLDASRPFSYWAVGFYARHGGPGALENLRSPRLLSVSNDRTIHAVLVQLNRRGIRIEPEVVRPLLDKALTSPETWPWNCVFEPALHALAASDSDAATRLAGTHLDRPDSPFHRAAIDFVREAAGLPMPHAIEPPAGMALTDVERGLVDQLAGCSLVYYEVCNGRLSQYFFNSSGGEWRRHAAALRAIGFEPGAAAVEEAARLIHPGGASFDREERIAQYADLSERKEKRLDELSELFYSATPRLRFMLRHKELFARIRKARTDAGLE